MESQTHEEELYDEWLSLKERRSRDPLFREICEYLDGPLGATFGNMRNAAVILFIVAKHRGIPNE